MGCVGTPAPWLGRARLVVRGTEAMETLTGYLAGGMFLPAALPNPKEQRVEQLLWRHLVALCKFTVGMCFFPDSLQLLYFPFKYSRSLLLLCFKYHQLASLCTHIFPISDSTCKHVGKIYLNFLFTHISWFCLLCLSPLTFTVNYKATSSILQCPS